MQTLNLGPSLVGSLDHIEEVLSRIEGEEHRAGIAREWLRRDNEWIPMPGASHGEILETLLADVHLTSRLVPDSHLATLAIEHGLELWSADTDFARFEPLLHEFPIVEAGDDARQSRKRT